MSKLFALMLLATLAGCVTDKQWTKAGSTAADLQQAKLECKYEAAKHDVTFDKATWQSELQQVSLIDMCLRVKGYTS